MSRELIISSSLLLVALSLVPVGDSSARPAAQASDVPTQVAPVARRAEVPVAGHLVEVLPREEAARAAAPFVGTNANPVTATWDAGAERLVWQVEGEDGQAILDGQTGDLLEIRF